MLQGTSKARVGTTIYNRMQVQRTRTEKKIEAAKDDTGTETQTEVEVEVKFLEWTAWEPTHYASISLAKKANGRGSTTFQGAKELPQ